MWLKMNRRLLLFIFLFSCASPFVVPVSSLKLGEDKAIYDYKDVSGSMSLSRIVRKKQKTKIITSQKLFSTQTNDRKLLEKSLVVSELGVLTIGKRKKPTLRPFASQYSVWFDGKEYFTQIRMNKKKKSLDVFMKSPEKKWQGKKSVKFPQGSYFCFFSQIPECLKSLEFFNRAIKDGKGDISIYVIWESYPYYKELYGNLEAPLFTQAKFTYKGVREGEYKFRLDLPNQVILYQFNKDYQYTKLFWVAQGMQIKRKVLGE
jgi:hypothetical protein